MSKRNAILDAATQLFSRNGFNETSMADLSVITGAARGTIFHHFKNKEDLFLNILENARQTILSAFQTHKKQARYATGLEKVEGVITFYLNFAGEREDLFLLLHRHSPYQIAETNSDCRSCLESIYTCLLDMFEDGISTGISDGSIRPCAPRNTAMIIFAMADGVTRLDTYHLYHAGSLYGDLITACKKILANEQGSQCAP